MNLPATRLHPHGRCWPGTSLHTRALTAGLSAHSGMSGESWSRLVGSSTVAETGQPGGKGRIRLSREGFKKARK